MPNLAVDGRLHRQGRREPEEGDGLIAIALFAKGPPSRREEGEPQRTPRDTKITKTNLARFARQEFLVSLVSPLCPLWFPFFAPQLRWLECGEALFDGCQGVLDTRAVRAAGLRHVGTAPATFSAQSFCAGFHKIDGVDARGEIGRYADHE